MEIKVDDVMDRLCQTLCGDVLEKRITEEGWKCTIRGIKSKCVERWNVSYMHIANEPASLDEASGKPLDSLRFLVVALESERVKRLDTLGGYLTAWQAALSDQDKWQFICVQKNTTGHFIRKPRLRLENQSSLFVVF
jgi:hypothetical protein